MTFDGLVHSVEELLNKQLNFVPPAAASGPRAFRPLGTAVFGNAQNHVSRPIAPAIAPIRGR
jgi:hypothetical protein